MSKSRPSVVIVGSGFGGIAAAIELTRAGFTDVTILEKADELGGVWRENTYPGAACDVPSPLYSYSYAPNPAWPRRYSGQADIHDYLKRTAAKYGVDGLIRYRTEVTEAQFDAARGSWQIQTSNGDLLDADVLVPAVGQLSRPALPRIPGMATFVGRSFHSAEWDHAHDLTGKRVAVVGTGASAIQFVPKIQPTVAGLAVFQRTAPYIAPKVDTEYGRMHHLLRRYVPATRLPGRVFVWAFCEWVTRGMTRSHRIASVMKWICMRKLGREVPDPVLRARLTPDYPIGCKRVLFSNDYLGALTQPNVELVTEPITEVSRTGVRTADGTEHAVDTIIYGTGFTSQDFLAPMKIRGVDGHDLQDSWPDGARAYLGLTVSGFPNMFLMYGPNTNLGAGSIIYMLEAQARYIRQAAERLAEAGLPAYLDVRADVADRFDADTQQRLSNAVWSMCVSWYRNASGRVATNWPGQVYEYHRRTRRLDLADYRLTRLSGGPAA
jgi:cation diffusion facilitator CzcD-associated flavoprotein CzcO